MKLNFLIAIALLYSSFGCSSSQTASSTTADLAAKATSGIVGSAAERSQNPKETLKIAGVCLLEENQQTTPCGSTILILIDSLGHEVSRTRTGISGKFSFQIQPAAYYEIRTVSKKFIVTASPGAPWTSETLVTVRLTYK